MSAAFDFRAGRRPRRPSLTPLVDVVFLLLIFFMLASRFGAEAVLGLAPGGAGGAWEGAPRLVAIGPGGGVTLNGRAVPLADLAAALAPLMPAADAPIVILPEDGVSVQALVDALAALEAAGYGTVAVVGRDAP